MAGKQKVRVVVRVRPQMQLSDNVWVQVLDSSHVQTFNHRNTDETLQYEFENVFGPEESQLAVYNSCAKDMLHHVLHGQNASIFAYGPTGAGKTHTILGTAQDPGLIPRCVKDLFSLINEESHEQSDQWLYDVTYSYLEIYQEKVQDLLDPSKTDLPIREDQHKNIFVTGLSQQNVKNVQDFNHTFADASKNRTTAVTRLNERSSRSHSILVINVLKTHKRPPFRKLAGKLVIIDLAGSEDNRRTGNQGIRLKESGSINSSLLALSQVVDALQKGQTCVPYRSSKLTRLLQDSLGGNSHSCMIVTLAPEERYYFDTYTTLLFARKTKKVVNVVRTNEIKDRPHLKRSFSNATSSSKSEADTSSAHAATPSKRACPDPPPFLSPLLRNQEKFQQTMKAEVYSRLEQLESRILSQMKQAPGPATNLAQPDSTTGSTSPGHMTQAIESIMSEMGTFKMQSSTCTASAQGQVTTECTCAKGPRNKARKGHLDACPKRAVKLAELSNSPLTPMFKKHAALRRRSKFQSCAAKLNQEGAKENIDKLQHSEAQLSHNARILGILNTGSVKDLQNLQTVGAKRAKLIQAWRELHGTFEQFDDLTSVPGLTYKYLSSFLKSNLVQT